MKPLKISAIACLVLLAVASFFLPAKSYYGQFLFFPPEEELTVKSIAELRHGDWIDICLLVVFAPALALAVNGSRFARNLPVVSVLTLLSSVMWFYAEVLVRFSMFETGTRFLSGSILFTILAVSGSFAFWILAVWEVSVRIRHRRRKPQVA